LKQTNKECPERENGRRKHISRSREVYLRRINTEEEVGAEDDQRHRSMIDRHFRKGSFLFVERVVSCFIG